MDFGKPEPGFSIGEKWSGTIGSQISDQFIRLKETLGQENTNAFPLGHDNFRYLPKSSTALTVIDMPQLMFIKICTLTWIPSTTQKKNSSMSKKVLAKESSKSSV